MNSKLKNGTQLVDALTPIAGPSAAELRRALAPKSLDRISAELNERQIDASSNFKRGEKQ
jgi:hypothetical protein